MAAIFEENPNRTLIHNVRVWISGVEVTPRLTSAPHISYSGRRGHNTASFTLSNASNGFILTEENVSGAFRTGGNPGEHSEAIKKKLWEFKSNPNRNVADETGSPRWHLQPDSPVLHALDAVFIAARWPYASPKSAAKWMPVFKGYITKKPFNDQLVKGAAHVDIDCADIRHLMNKARVQTNYLLVTEGYSVSANGVGRSKEQEALLNAIDPVIMGGILSDLQLPSNLSTPFADLTLEETVRLLVIGQSITSTAVQEQPQEGQEAGIFGRATGLEGNVIASLFDEVNGRISGEATAPLGTDLTQNEDGTVTLDVKAFGRFREGVTLNWPESPNEDGSASDTDKSLLSAWHRMCLFGADPNGSTSYENQGAPWTDEQVVAHGEACCFDGARAPHAMSLHFLLPSDGSGVRGLVEYTVDTGSDTRTWATRLDIIEEFLEKLDYHWFVTGSGDIVVEFPMYDFTPEMFGDLEAALTFKRYGEIKSVSFEDDIPQVPTCIRATGQFTGPEGSNFAPTFFENRLTTNIYTTLYAPGLASRIGMEVEQVSFPFIHDICRLRQFTVLHFQRRLVEASELGAEYVYRPTLLPNRPVYFGNRDRMAWVSGVDLTVSPSKHLGMPSSSAAFHFVRKRDHSTGRYNLITGVPNLPITYTGAGPSLNPPRGIVVSESFTPDGGSLSRTNSDCPGEVTGAPESTSGALGLPNDNPEAIGNVFTEDALRRCSTDETLMSQSLQNLFAALQVEADERYRFQLELTCTHNDGTPHEDLAPYGHGSNPSTAFDIKVIRPDGAEGTDEDYARVGAIGKELGLKWGGDVGEGAQDVADIQKKILTAAEFHVGRRTPYIWGGDFTNKVRKNAAGYTEKDVGLDCCGFVVWCYIQAGIYPEGTDLSVASLWGKLPEPTGDPKPGDTVFYKPAGSSKQATHVAILGEGNTCYTASGPGSQLGNLQLSLDYQKDNPGKGIVTKKSSYLYWSNGFVRFGTPFNVNLARKYRNHFSL